MSDQKQLHRDTIWPVAGYADRLFDLTDRVVLVTGGSRGLGREMAFAAARCGADVVIASRKYDTCVTTADEIAAEGTPSNVVPHKVMPGNRPSTSILATKLTPSVVGQLVALYEHQVFTEGVVWGIDSFDQWGVELGKKQANALLPAVTGAERSDAGDSSTDDLIAYYRQHRV